MNIKKLRNYKIKIDQNLLENEYIIVANNKLKSLLDATRSTATINTYMYICLRVNRSKDKGYVRNIRCKTISDFLGIPLSTVQDSVRSLTKRNFIERTYNSDRTSDYRVIGYSNILSKAYTKIPAKMVFNNLFLQSKKDEVSGALHTYSSVYSNSVAHMKKLQSISFLKDKQNYELVGQAETSRAFNKQTLLKKIKRNNTKDLDRVLDKLQQLGLSVTNMFREGISKTTNYIIGISEDTLSGLFRPFINSSHIENNPLAFNRVDRILADTGLYKHVDKSHHEDLTQMYVEYGELFFHAGVISLQNVIYKNYDLVDDGGEKINNLCAYFRTSVDTFIEKCKSKNQA